MSAATKLSVEEKETRLANRTVGGAGPAVSLAAFGTALLQGADVEAIPLPYPAP